MPGAAGDAIRCGMSHSISDLRPILLWASFALFCTAAHAQDLRIENEYKLTVPDYLTEPLWQHLVERYESVQELLGHHGGHYAATFADERFFDQYFDTPSSELLRRQGGIRHRTRYIIEGEDMRKDGRELVQIKLNRPGDLIVNRTEIKFPVREDKQATRPGDTHPVIGLVRHNRRDNFMKETHSLGIDATQLAPTLLLEQRRRRIYLTRDGAAFATITLDEVRTRYWWRTVEYVEAELELNENAYTLARQDHRDEMQAVNDTIKRDILDAFPEIYVDQTPKYNKSFDALCDEYLWFPLAMRFGMPLEPLLGAGAVAMTLGGPLFVVRRLRRGRAAH